MQVLTFVMSYRCFFFFQAEDGIRDLVRSRGLGDVYKRQQVHRAEDHGHVADRVRLAVVARLQDHEEVR